MPYTTPMGLLVSGFANGPALANSAAEAIISPTPDQALPANSLNAGDTIVILATGRYGITATPTLTFRLRYGGLTGTLLVASAALTPAAGTTNTWMLEAQISVRSAGIAGTVLATAAITGVTGATATNLAPATAPVIATIDTTAVTANQLVLTGQWNAANAANTLTVHQWIVMAS